MAWYSVRCIFSHKEMRRADYKNLYEERIILLNADDLDHSIELAEQDASRYAKDVSADYIGLAQAFQIGEFYSHISDEFQFMEVFSLMRDSNLEEYEYLDTFFDTNRERTR